MAIYKRIYKGYTGPITPAASRWLILTRYSYTRIFQNRFLTLFLATCFFFPLFCIAYLYLAQNASFLTLFRLRPNQLWAVDGRWFYYFCSVQGALAYLLIAFVGPNLVSPDLVNGGMQLYFSRPFSRIEYVLGKSTVLIILLSLITWIPALLVYGIQGSLAGWEWFTANFSLIAHVVFGMLVWVLVLSLIAMALSAWVKWKIAAGAAVLAVFFAGAGFGNAINRVMRTDYGGLIDLTQVIHVIWADLFGYDLGAGYPAVTWCWIVLAVVSAICIWMLSRKIRAFEVVK